ncbi:hypothetical protein DSO57_1002992 [Entomophthora muscae]|uniref:Uncharacterized protein n=1 Tax=Entomophthora muscae TaxID=34485 RepID=A0ACC2SXV8_9FUNG|nr:hypothetical protein DSO57_1002992 [Entomophthora muscae]
MPGRDSKLGRKSQTAIPLFNQLRIASRSLSVNVTKTGIKPSPSHQAGLAGGRDLLAPEFFLFKVDPGAGIIPALVVAVGPLLGPKAIPKPWWVWLGLGRLILAAQ